MAGSRGNSPPPGLNFQLEKNCNFTAATGTYYLTSRAIEMLSRNLSKRQPSETTTSFADEFFGAKT